MGLKKKVILAAMLGIGLYGGIYLYALNSEAFRFVKEALENSPAMARQVGECPKVTLPLLGAFKEKYVNSSVTVTMRVMVVGNIKSLPVDVKVIRKEGVWKIGSASTGGIPVDLD